MKVYSYDEQLISMGAVPCVIAKNLMLYKPGPRGGNDLSAVDLDTLAATVRSMPPGKTVLLDIEAYDATTEPDRASQNIAFAARVWKQLDPTATIGVYRIVPDLHYDGVVKLAKLLIDRKADASQIDEKMEATAAWQRQNDRLATAIVPAVDYLCPCLYAVQDWPYWKVFAHAQLVEAKRLARGKRVLPIVWATFRNLQPISDTQWGVMCKWLATHHCVDGIMVYSSVAPACERWREVLIAACGA